MAPHAPVRPKPETLSVLAGKTAVLVLDGSRRWESPEEPCHRLVPGVSGFLGRAREAGLPIIYTVSFQRKGTPEGEICRDLQRRASEPVIFPDGFDKFTGGELQSFLNLHDVDTLIITGYRSNICVLHTATTAARELGYQVIIPTDGVAARTNFEQEYTLFHFTVLPRQAAERFRFTELDMIGFGGKKEQF